MVPCTQYSQQRRYTFLHKLVTSCLIRERLTQESLAAFSVIRLQLFSLFKVKESILNEELRWTYSIFE